MGSNISQSETVGKITFYLQPKPLELNGYTQFPLVNVLQNNTIIEKITTEWGTTKTANKLTVEDTYTFSTDIIKYNGFTATPLFNPIEINAASEHQPLVHLSYMITEGTGATGDGKITIDTQALPAQFTGYSLEPIVSFTGDNSFVDMSVLWGTTKTADHLVVGETYSFSTPVIDYNNITAVPFFMPEIAVAATAHQPLVHLKYSLTGVTGPTGSPTGVTGPTGSPTGVTGPTGSSGLYGIDHVVIIMLENATLTTTINNGPYLKSLTETGAWLKDMQALFHPSQPNYLALIAGSNYGVTSDDNVTVNAKTIAELLEAKNLTWKGYAENLPSQCYQGTSDGLYAKKHVPFLSIKEIVTTPSECAKIVPGTQFFTDLSAGTLPNFSFYTPNLDNDGHNTDAKTASAWLEKTFGPVLSNAETMKNMLIVITFDEGSGSDQNIYCTFNGASVKPGFISNIEYNHYSVLAAFETIFGLGNLGKGDVTAVAINDIWQ